MTNNESGGSDGDRGQIELSLRGDVEAVRTDDEPPMVVPRTVTVPRPQPGEHVAVVRAPPEVTTFAVYEQDNAESFDSDLPTRAADGNSEFWIDASSIANADIAHIDTRGDDLETVDLEIEYRGWKARLKKPLREYKQKRRARKAFALRS